MSNNTMNQNKEVTHLTRPGSTTEIPGPYLSPEQTESFPLKSKDKGQAILFRKCCCWPCCRNTRSSGNEGIGGLRPIIACFFTFSIALTVALVLQIRFGEPQVPPQGSVASDSRECSQIGASILKKGGNAVDAAVATTVCLGVVLPHLTGIGGGGFLAIYDHRRRMVVDAVDFRETAPQKFSADSGAIGSNPTGRMVGVPGFLRGLGLAHKLYGRLSWSELITPSINLCRTGFLVPSNLIMARSLLFSPVSFANLRQTNPTFWNHFESLEAGHNMRDYLMATTLQAIAKEGPEAFYNGSLTADFVEAIINSGGQVTRDDLAKYEPIRRPLIRVPFGSSSWVYTIGAPSGGPLLLAALSLYAKAYDLETPLPHQTVTEQTKGTSDGDNIATILKNFSVKYTPTEPTVPGTARVYVTPIPNEGISPLNKNAPLILKGDSKHVNTAAKKTDFQSNLKKQLQQQGHWESHSGQELGHAIIEPYKLKRSVLVSPLEREDNSSAVEEKKPELDVDVADLDLLLKSIKDAYTLHSQFTGDPAFSNDPSKGYQVAVDPTTLLNSLKDKIPQGVDSGLFQFFNHQPAGSNVAVVDTNELYVSVVSGLNTLFGSQVLTNGGYLLNNALVNFDGSKEEDMPIVAAQSLNHSEIEPPPHVFPTKTDILPKPLPQNSRTNERVRREQQQGMNGRSDNSPGSGKRPLSESTVAFVILRRGIEGSEGEVHGNQAPESGIEPCGQRIILGSADAGYAAQVLIRMLLKGLPLVESIEATRIKPQAPPSNYGIEVGPESGKWSEESVTSNTFLSKGTHLPLPYPSVNGVQEIGDTLASHADSRGGGVSARF